MYIFRGMSFGLERACLFSWYSNWSSEQRLQFGRTLINQNKESLADATLESLMSQLSEISLSNKGKDGPSVFECQLKIFQKWYSSWSETDKTTFQNDLNAKYPEFSIVLKGCSLSG